MTRIMPLVFFLLTFSGCDIAIDTGDRCPDGTCPNDGCPVYATGWSDVPIEIRDTNYAGGSCMYASLCTALRWVGLYDVADQIRSHYQGGQSVDGLTTICDHHGLRFAATVDGDEELLEWCSRTRRAAAIHYYPMHAVTFVGYRGASDGQQYAVLIDNNDTGQEIPVPKDQFIREWNGYGGRALVPLYSPPPNKPRT